MIAVPESLFQGVYLGLDPVAVCVYVRLLQLSALHGGDIPIPPDMSAEAALVLATDLKPSDLRRGVKALLVPRGGSPMIRLDPEAVVVLGPEVERFEEREPNFEESVERRRLSPAEKQRAYRERMARRSVTEEGNGVLPGVTGAGNTVGNAEGNGALPGSGNGLVDQSSLSLSPLLSPKKEEEEERKHEKVAETREGNAPGNAGNAGNGNAGNGNAGNNGGNVTPPVTPHDFPLIGALEPEKLTTDERLIEAVLVERQALWPAATPQVLASAARRAQRMLAQQAMAGRRLPLSEWPLAATQAVEWVAQRASGFSHQTQEQRLTEFVRAIGRQAEWAARRPKPAGPGTESSDSEFIRHELERQERDEVNRKAKAERERKAVGQ